MTILLALLVFVCSIAINFAHVRCTIATVEKRKFAAANWGAIVYSMSCIGWLVAFTHGWWVLGVELVGFYIGTLIGVRK